MHVCMYIDVNVHIHTSRPMTAYLFTNARMHTYIIQHACSHTYYIHTHTRAPPFLVCEYLNAYAALLHVHLKHLAFDVGSDGDRKYHLLQALRPGVPGATAKVEWK